MSDIIKVYSKLWKIPDGNAGIKIQEGCLVLEGGAFRGLYTQGAMDCWMKHGLNLSCVIGVSAGALAGMNCVAGQIGRSARANLEFRHYTDYVGTGAVKKSHSPIRLDFLLDDYNEFEPMNEERFYSDLQRYIAVVTNCKTGKAEYMEKGKCSDIMSAIKASASMPFVSPMVPIGDGLYLDGGCACKIPYQWALDEGYSKIVIIKTREDGFRKKEKKKKAAKAFYLKYPEFAGTLDKSNTMYNHQCDEIDKLKESGRAFVLSPSESVQVSRVESDMEKLGHLYWLGYRDAMNSMEALKQYLNN